MLCQICQERSVVRIFMHTCQQCVSSIYDDFDWDMMKWLQHAGQMFYNWRLNKTITRGPSYHGKTGNSPVNPNGLLSMVINGKSVKQIAKHFGVTERCIRRRIRKLNIEQKKVPEGVTQSTVTRGKRALARLSAY